MAREMLLIYLLASDQTVTAMSHRPRPPVAGTEALRINPTQLLSAPASLGAHLTPMLEQRSVTTGTPRSPRDQAAITDTLKARATYHPFLLLLVAAGPLSHLRSPPRHDSLGQGEKSKKKTSAPSAA